MAEAARDTESTTPGLPLRWQWFTPATAAFLLALVTLGHTPVPLAQAFIPSLAMAQPQLSAYMATHSPHNTLALNEASFESTTSHPTPSTHSSLLGTNSSVSP